MDVDLPPPALPLAARLRAFAPKFAVALGFRFVCYAAMTALALLSELHDGPTLRDAVISRIPYVPWVDRVNYLLWLVVYVPLALAFLVTRPERWFRYMITGGLVSLARGVCIAATTLGPPDPSHAGRGIAGMTFGHAFVDLLSPIAVFGRGSARAYLTQDLFFSGHTATTFLLLLYVWQAPRLRVPAVIAHVSVVASVFFSHLHYTIDVLGAYAVTFALYALREWRPLLRSGSL